MLHTQRVKSHLQIHEDQHPRRVTYHTSLTGI